MLYEFAEERGGIVIALDCLRMDDIHMEHMANFLGFGGAVAVIFRVNSLCADIIVHGLCGIMKKVAAGGDDKGRGEGLCDSPQNIQSGIGHVKFSAQIVIGQTPVGTHREFGDVIHAAKKADSTDLDVGNLDGEQGGEFRVGVDGGIVAGQLGTALSPSRMIRSGSR